MSFGVVESEMKSERHEGSQLLNLKIIITYTHFMVLILDHQNLFIFIALISLKRSISASFQFEGILRFVLEAIS